MNEFTTSHLEDAVIEGSGLPPLFVASREQEKQVQTRIGLRRSDARVRAEQELFESHP